MMSDPISAQQAAARLRDSLDADEPMTPEEVQALLPELIAAEQSGEHVDADERFAPLLRHLDANPESMAQYVRLSEDVTGDVTTILDEQEALPEATANPPFFFKAEPAPGTVIVSLLQGIYRGFEMLINLPDLQPALQSRSGVRSEEGKTVQLFSDRVRAMTDTPQIDVMLHLFAGPAELVVTVGETPVKRWQIDLSLDDRIYTARTDRHGVAHLFDLSVDELQEATAVRLTCTALDKQESK
jgi:hypothetical protein